MNVRLRLLALILLVIAGLVFGVDAATFGYQAADPARGRGPGCYSLLDDIFGTTQPSDALRSTEFGLSVIFFGVAGVIAYRERRRRHANRLLGLAHE